jgi:DNA-binding CsgD family transcriptional regulator/tetratricopeptide (TPR) repeat protein
MGAPVSSPFFVGREAPLAILGAALDSAAEGNGSTVLVAGESGIGKSRLVAELSVRARGGGFTVLTGECLELAEGELPYAALIGALRSLLRERPSEDVAEVLGDRSGELGRLLPELRPGGGPAGGEFAVEGAQARLFEQLLGALSRLGSEAPVLLVIEDLHWADRSTRDFLAFLVRNARRERLALVATYRSDELHRRHPLRPFVLELERSGQATRIDLAPFDEDELKEQLTAIAGVTPAPDLLERLRERSDGNPFFAEELLAASAGPGGTLPESLRDALLLRVESLSQEAQSVLQIAAVAGRTIDHSLLGAVTSSGEVELNAAIREAISGYVLIQDPNSTGYSFRHALLREAVYGDLLPGERRSLHVALAEALEEHPDLGSSAAASAAEIAHHWHEAHDLPRAMRASIEAGLGAERIRALAEASLHFQRALEVWDVAKVGGEEPALGRIEVMRRAAEAEGLAGDAARASALARAALELVDADRDPVTAALIHERIGRYMWIEGRGEESLPENRRAVELMAADPPSADRALVLAALGQMLMLCNRFDECLPPCEEALAIAREVGAESIEAHALNSVAATYCHRGEPGRAVEATGEAREIANRLGLIEEIGRSYVNGSDALDQAGRVEESIALAQEGIERCRELGAGRGFGGFLEGEIASRYLRGGRWAEAESLVLSIAEGRPSGIVEGQVNLILALLRADQGRLEEASRHTRRAREIVIHSGGGMWLAPLSMAEATIHLWQGEPEVAAAGIDQCLEQIEGAETSFYTACLYEFGARALAEIGERTADQGAREAQLVKGQALLTRLDSALAGIAGTPPPAALASRAACAAELTRLSGQDGIGAWLGARTLWQELGDSYRAAYAGWRAAEATLGGEGTRGDADGFAGKALTTARELGATPLSSELESLGRRARLEMSVEEHPGGAPTELAEFDLTPRELEVLTRLAEGMTNPEIAAELFISQKTASVHVSHILAKLGVANRAKAAALAHRLGIA